MFNKLLLEAKMQSVPFRWGLNLSLALLIFCLAELGRLLGLPNLALAISLLWPATGISLAAVLLFGYGTWPGILLGNFCYNFLHLYIYSQHALSTPLMSALFISLGSMFQALLGGIIIKHLSSPGHFSTIRDIFIFLLPASLLTCLLASSIGVLSLYLFNPLPWKPLFQIWLTFWLGDTTGIYIFTPLIVVWLTYKPSCHFQNYVLEAGLMFLSFLFIYCVAFIWSYPIALLFIPLSLWITYRFRMHGATLAIALIALTTIITTFHGYGAFIVYVTQDPVAFLVSFLMTIIATCLVLAAVINEREEAWNLLQDYNKDLQKEVQKHSNELKEILNEVYIKEKLASLGILASGIGREIKNPLKGIENFAAASMDCINLLKQIFSGIKDKLQPGISLSVSNNFETLENCLRRITKYEAQADRIVAVMQDQASRTSSTRIEIKSINPHTLLTRCINELIGEKAKWYPEFTFTIVKEFDKNVSMILGIPEDLSHAFMSILDNSFFSLKEKSMVSGTNYEPILKVKTLDLIDYIEITFRDNGLGLSERKQSTLFESFAASKSSADETGIGLSLTYDIIVNEHHGEINIDSKEGEYLQLTLKLPKSLKTKKQTG